ncbi:hypothetical protein CDO73_01900 [Saccharibacillus sp. O23]|uniref:hypothetical protein n=1 Tax=Saccharibacillus sp. O23 TaxID=2009338 RepID=UPI000B4E08FB|nr:hypothetical protein [Saccharibacillus sp. O23]OWR32384.1 hypothetical protein CDO73_01900 [Saccharibacillus sp. O23]
MGKFMCRCGKLLSNSLDPNEVELWVYTDKEFSEKVTDKESTWLIDLPEYAVWRCTRCERIYFFKDLQPVKVYKLEEDWQDDGEDEDDDEEEGEVVIIET